MHDRRATESRIVNPADPLRIFSWLICSTANEMGNAILYEQFPEDPDRFLEALEGQVGALA